MDFVDFTERVEMSKSALIVDDSYTMRNMVSITLKDEGFDVESAEDGIDALNKISSNKFDLIITDINMPNMNGIEFVKNLRNNDDYKYTPVLVLTTEGGEDKKEEGKKVGATGWIIKPFDPEILMGAVNRVCA